MRQPPQHGPDTRLLADWHADANQQPRAAEAQSAENARRLPSFLLAASRVQQSGQGITGQHASPLMVDEASAAEIELAALMIQRGREARANRLEQEPQPAADNVVSFDETREERRN